MIRNHGLNKFFGELKLAFFVFGKNLIEFSALKNDNLEKVKMRFRKKFRLGFSTLGFQKENANKISPRVFNPGISKGECE
jgi:hypothetical protein